MFWCSESWALREEDWQKLKTAENCMLRKILGAKRRPNEDWVGWVQRVTRLVRSKAERAGLKAMVQKLMQRKWNWAGHVARRSAKTWLFRVTAWRDKEWEEMILGPKLRRSRTGPWTRWVNDVETFCQKEGAGEWKRVARDREKWAELRTAFASM